MTQYQAFKFGIVGAGSWATALAVACNRAGSQTMLYSRNETVRQMIADKRVNEAYLPDVFIDPSIEITGELSELCHAANAIILVVPAQQVRPVCIALSDQLQSHVPIILASKGIERGSLMLMHEVAGAILPENPLMILSGPNFAREVALGLPAAATLAGTSRTLCEKLIYAMSGKFFRPYYSDDLAGVQVGGAVKNVVAIACGICMGRGLGENAQAALITRALSEMKRLAVAKGGQEETLAGLSGLGDLMLTCTSLTSRNMALGYALGQGKSLADLTESGSHGLTEGVATAESVYHLSRQLGISMPICQSVYEVLDGLVDIDGAIERLLTRPLSAE